MSKQPSFQNAIKWAYTASLGEKGLSALFMFVLAAVLGPREFGTVSIAVIYISFLQMFLDQGLALALIQTKNLETEHLSTVFWFDVILSLVLAALGLSVSRPLASLNHAPEAAIVIAALTPSILLEACAIVPMSLLRRRMDFKSISIRTNASMLAGGVVGITMALMGYRFWALVAQQLIRDAVAVVLLWKLTSWRPSGGFSWKHFRQLVPFSSANFLGQLGTFADGQGGAVLLGAMFGPTAVGLYRLGERITNSVITMSMSSIQSVALPEFARLQDRPTELHRTALQCIRLSGAVTVPALTALVVLGHPLMVIIGPRWLAAVDVLRVLSLTGIVLVFSFFTGPLLQGIGRAREAALLEWGRVLAGLAALFIAGWLVRGSSTGHQVIGIALAKLLVGALLTTPLFIAVLLRVCRIRIREFIAAVMPSVAASAASAFLVLLVSASGRLANQPAVVQIAIEGALGAAVGLWIILTLDTQLRASLDFRLRRAHTPVDADA